MKSGDRFTTFLRISSMKVKQIEINHPNYGKIIISTSVPDNIEESIGDVVTYNSERLCLYYANVLKNEDGTFDIKGLRVIKPDSVNVGWMNNSKGNKNYIEVVKNMSMEDGDMTVYPNGILSVIYND